MMKHGRLIGMKKFADLKGKAFLFLLFFRFLWFMNFFCRKIFAPIMPLIEDEFFIGHARASSLFGLSTGIYLPSAIPFITEYYDERT